MNKENKEKEEEEKPTLLTPQQRALISQKYKAAKSLLSLHSHSSTPPSKRPRFLHSPPPPPLKPYKVDVQNSTLLSKGERTPLKDLQLNINSQVASKGCGLKNDKCYTTPLICNSVDKFCDSATKESNVHPKDENLYTPVNSQVKRFECFSTSNCSLLSSVLDDEFDESLLEEIDLLCERSSVKESQRKEDTEEEETQKSKTNADNNTDIYDKLESPQGIQDQNEQTRDIDVKQAKVFSDMPENYSNYMEKLNQDQLEAASTDASTPLIVVAGPGSGKTSTMVGRVLMLLNQGIGSSHILAMTFTTAAASEMRDRIGAVAGKEVSKELTISTFHSFSLQLCRSHADKLGRTTEFLIYGNGQQRRAVIEAIRLLESEKSKQALGACDTGGPTDDVKVVNFKERSQKWQKFVTRAKASGKTPEEFSREGDELGATVLKNYNDILSSCNALDYHDLISCSVKLLSDYPEVFEECQTSWKAVIVDEFQDTSSMQYRFLKLLSSHGRITVVGDDDQSIFSFNGADISGFDSFRRDFPTHKEVRLKKNYRSTRCIVEAASSLIKHNIKRCQMKQVLTDNSSGSKITVKECRSEDAQCAYVVDKILESVSDSSETDCSFGNIAILYRRQITGKCFQVAFRERKIPFNVHGVAFYRKKVIKAIMALLQTTLPGCDDGPFRQVFKTFLPYEKEEKKRVLDHIEKVSTIRKCSFISAASDIFNAKISGTFNRSQLRQGRKVLVTLDMISKLVHKEQSISSVITSAGNLLPQKYLLEKRAVIDSDGGKLLNEDHDLRSVLQYLLDDVNDFLTSQYARESYSTDDGAEKKGCIMVVKAFVDYISEREKENFRSRRNDNENSVTLTTIHQSKGLEWDIVFIVKANESEIPLLHEHNGIVSQSRNSLEEERRLLYVAMTRARKKLYILYVKMDSNWQVLHPSRFLREIPTQLIEVQGDMNLVESKVSPPKSKFEDADLEEAVAGNNSSVKKSEESFDLENIDAWNRNSFLKRFNVDDRAFVSRIFHQWAKKKAFQDPKRLLDKVRFVIDERLRLKKDKKDILASLKSSLQSIEAFQFAEYVIKWDQIPSDERAHMTREKQEYFQKFRMENAMNTSAPTSKQLGYLRNLGCTVTPDSKLHASRLIEQYKSL